MEGKNISGKIAKDRDDWLRMENHLLEEMKKKRPKIKEIIEYLNHRFNAGTLYNGAIKTIEEIEKGEIQILNSETGKNEIIELTEKQIYEKVELTTVIFAAIEDAEREHQKERDCVLKKDINYYEQIKKRIDSMPKDKLHKILKERKEKESGGWEK